MLHEFVSVRSLMDSTTFMDGIVMGQITPGPIVITATFIGYWLYGLPGGLVATVTVFLPSFLLVVGIVHDYDRLRKLVYFNRAIAGILPSFVGLLLSVNIRFALNVPWNLYHAFFACGSRDRGVGRASPFSVRVVRPSSPDIVRCRLPVHAPVGVDRGPRSGR